MILWNVDTVRGITKTKMECFLGKNDVNIFKNFVTNFKDLQNDLKEMKKKQTVIYK